MALRTILTDTDELLRKKSKPVENFDEKLGLLLDDMADTMYHTNGVGLAAPQIGILRRAVVVDIGDELIELMNPEILHQEDEQEGIEGCLSSPGEFGIVKRPYMVRVQAQDRNGNTFILEGEELMARALCHEIDHLNGQLFKDIVEYMVAPEDLDEYMDDED